MFYRTAHAPVGHVEVTYDWWHHTKQDVLCKGGVCFIGDRRLRTSAERAISGYNPKDWLLSHVTIMASVDTEEGPGEVTYPDYQVTLATSQFVNNNGDAWTKPLLLATFRTFIGAENYVEHCIRPGTGILIADGSQKPIEEVQVGDEVVSHTGRVRKVLETKVNPFTDFEGIYTICGHGSPNRLQATGGHPLFVYDPVEKTKKWVKVRDLDRARHCLFRPTFQGEQPAPSDMTLNKARLIGLFLAEGCYWKHPKSFKKGKKKGDIGGVQFSFGWSEEHTLAAEAAHLLDEEFSDEIKFHRKRVPQNRGVRKFLHKSRTTQVCCNVPTMAEWFLKYCGQYAHNKTLPEEVLCWPLDIQREVFQGWHDGDGGVTCSETLAWQMAIIGQRLGYSISFYEQNRTKFNTASRYEEGGGVAVFANGSKARIRYELVFKDTNTGVRLGCRPDGKPLSNRVWIFPVEGGLAFKIRSIENETYLGDVYNLEVEEDHSYLACGFASHNCQNPVLSKGKVIDAVSREIPVLHPKTKEPLNYEDGRPVTSIYIDILVATSRKFEELCRSVTAGEVNSMSMGCLLKFTICSECGKVMYRDADACSHIRFNKGGTHVDFEGRTRRTSELCGHIADKTSCEFVESSWVTIPAFRGAKRRNVLHVDKRKFATKMKKALSVASERFDTIYSKARAASIGKRLVLANKRIIPERIAELALHYPEP